MSFFTSWRTRKLDFQIARLNKLIAAYPNAEWSWDERVRLLNKRAALLYDKKEKS